MKKFAAFIFVFLSSLIILSAQEGAAKIYETFSWNPVSSAKKYEVIIEKQSGADWVPYFSTIVKECSIEYPLEPDTYRICVVSINSLGRKSKQNQWIKFKILDEKIPYLFSNYYQNNRKWNSPVLYINNVGDAVPEDDIYILPEPEMADNTLYLKGKNIFYEGTEFSLIPVDSSLFEGKEYPEKTSGRKNVSLSVIQRNNKKDYVIVSYNPSDLKSGYYKIEAKNPGGYSAAISILVLINEKLKISPVEMKFDSTYKTVTADIKDKENLEISVKGEGVSEDTKFYLEPAAGPVVYPYETKLERQKIELSSSEKDEDSGNLSLKPENAELLKPGFYNVIAESPDGQKESFPVLIEADFNSEHESEVTKITSKPNSKKQTLDLTIEGKHLNQDLIYTLVSQYNDDIEGNQVSEVKPSVNSRGTKATVELALSKIPIGKYVLMVESDSDAYPIYMEVTDQLKTNILDISMEEAEKWLTSSVTEKTAETNQQEVVENPVKTDDEDSEPDVNPFDYIKYSNPDYIVKEIKPYFFPNIYAGGFIDLPDIFNNNAYNFGADVETQIFNIDWFSFNAGLRCDVGIDYVIGNLKNATLAAELSGDFIIPFENFNPYCGLGFGYAPLDSRTSDWSQKDLYSSFRVGAVICNLVEIKALAEFHDIFTNYNFKSFLSVGARFNIRPTIWENQLAIKDAEIFKPGKADGASYGDEIITYTALSFTGQTKKISGFANAKNLKKLTLSSDVEEISDNAFRTCLNLSEIYIPQDSKLKKIGAAAFANDSKVKTIFIPATVTEIGENAFANWTDGQEIYLGWDSKDGTERNLNGLETTEATIFYSDKTLYKNQYYNPFEDPDNWNHYFGKPKITFFEVDGAYKRGIQFNFLERSEYDSIKQEPVSQELSDILKNAKGIKFKTRGNQLRIANHSKYKMILTADGKNYYRNFLAYIKGGMDAFNPGDRTYSFKLNSFKPLSKDVSGSITDSSHIENIYIVPDYSYKSVFNQDIVDEKPVQGGIGFGMILYDIEVIK